MSDEHSVSRRVSLKSIGAIGAVLVVGKAAAIAGQADPKPAGNKQDKPVANVVDLASSRFMKGHS
jgi:hypothetical protein